MILVVGETLVDLVVAPDGRIDPVLGGAPSNAAVAAARLGATVAFAGAISTDTFGDRLIDRLRHDDVDTSPVVRTDAPTSLALAELDESGAASYAFYFEGTSAPALDHVALDGAHSLLTGGLALVLEPMASAVDAAVAEAAAQGIPVVIDVNARPAIIDDLPTYRERVERLLRSAAIVKVSDDDLALLAPDLSDVDAAAAIVAAGAGAVVVTRGASETTIVTPDDRVTIPIEPAPPGRPVVDTIGAGDTFVAGLVTSLAESGALAPGVRTVSLDDLEAAVRLGHAAAAVTVTRRGADPPRRAELDR